MTATNNQAEVVTSAWSPITSRTPAGHHNCECHTGYGASQAGDSVCFACGRHAPTLPVEHPDDEGWFYGYCRHCIP